MSDGSLRQLFRKHLPGFDFQAIESSTGDGIPDLNYAAPSGVEGWIEMKQCSHWRCTIRPAQVGWAERRLRFHPRVFCAVRRDRDELWFYHGSALRSLCTKRLDHVSSYYHWLGGPARWNWAEISRILST